MSYIGENMKSLKTLKSINIHFKECLIGDHNICEGLKRLKFIENLSLTVNSVNVPDGLEACLKRLRFLKNITLNISNDFKSILRGLKCLNSGQHLAINFSHPDLTDEILLDFGNSLKTLCCLRSLRFMNKKGQVTPAGLDNFLESIKGVSSLENLQLFPVHATKDVIYPLKKLSFLKKLVLDFANPYDIGDSPFIWVADCLKTLISLQSVTLNFLGIMSRHSDQVLLPLASSLKNLTSLKKISLASHNFALLTDSGVCGFFDELKALSNLQEMNIDFKGQSTVSEKGVQRIRRFLKGLKPLKKAKIQSQDSSFAITYE